MAIQTFGRTTLAVLFISICHIAVATPAQEFTEWPLGLDSTGQEYQRAVDAAEHPGGGWTAVWVDFRLGHPALYARSFDAADVPLGPGAPLTDGIGLFDIDLISFPVESPRVAATGDGAVVAVWREVRFGIDRIQATIVRGNRLDSATIVVNDLERQNSRSEPWVAVSGDRILVTWSEGVDNFSEIYGQILTLDLESVGANFLVHPEAGGGQGAARTVSIPDGWTVAWRSEIASGRDRVFLRNLDRDGALVAAPVVAEEVEDIDQDEPTLVVLPDRLFVAWIASRIGSTTLKGRTFDQGLAPVGSPFLVVGDNETVTPRFPVAVGIADASVLVFWSAGPATRSRFYAREVALPGDPIGSFVVVDDPDPPEGETLLPRDLSVQGTSGAGARLLWWDDRDGWDLVYRLNVDHSGAPVGTPTAIEIDDGSASQILPFASLFDDGTGIASWCDFRTGGLTIYGSWLGTGAAPVDASFRISEATGGAVSAPATNLRDLLRNRPATLALDDGRAAAAWTRIFSNGELRVYLQLYDKNRNRLGNNIEMPLAFVGAQTQSNPTLASTSDSSFFAVYRDGGADTDGDIIARHFLSDGTSIDTVHVADLYYAGASQEKPAIASSGTGETVVAWLDDRQGNYDVYIQRLGPTGKKIERNIMVNAFEENPIPQSNPAIAATSDRYVVVWDDNPLGRSAISGLIVVLPTAKRTLEEQIHFQIAPLRSGFKYPAVSMADDGRFVVTFWDTSEDSARVVAQRFNRDGTIFGPRYSVTALGGSTSAIPGGVFADTDSILYAWSDNREGKGWDVRVRKVSWDYGDVYTAVAITGWWVEPSEGGIEVRWTVPTARSGTPFRLWRQIDGDPGLGEDPGSAARLLSNDWIRPLDPGGNEYVVRDTDAPPGRAVHYWIEDPTGEFAGPWSGRIGYLSLSLALRALDNPFRESTRLTWSIPNGEESFIELFDVRGRSIRRESLALSEGTTGEWIWDGRDRNGRSVPAGIYWIRLRTDTKRSEPIKLLRLR